MGVRNAKMTVPAAATRLTPGFRHGRRRGLAAAWTAFVIWGVLPLYLKQLESVKRRPRGQYPKSQGDH